MHEILLQATSIPFFDISLERFVFLAIAALAGGAFGAYLGALPAFVFTGFLTFTGSLVAYLQTTVNGALMSAVPAEGISSGVGIVGTLGFGAMFGPHVSFVGGVAASTYMGKKYPELAPNGWDLHPGKVITESYDTAKLDIIGVGAIFGFGGWLLVLILDNAGLNLAVDAVAIAVMVMALIARVAFGYPLIGTPAGSSILDVTPFERSEQKPVTGRDGEPIADGGVMQMKTGVWLGHQYKWFPVAVLGVVGGVAGAYLWVFTGQFFLGYGISALSLLFLNLGVAKIPVTHHITLLGSVGGALGAEIYGGEIAAAFGGEAAIAALVGGAVLGLISALLGELSERIFYMHGGNHVDPPAVAIAATMVIVYVLYALNVTNAAGYLTVG
jgi:hypothetical protein